MFSGNPDPVHDLAMLLQKKRGTPQLSCEVVSEAARWFKAQLKGADVPFSYFSCDKEAYHGYAAFLVQIDRKAVHSRLEVKILEIDERAFAFCSVNALSTNGSSSFSYFTEIAGEDGRRALLAYTADFLLGAGHGES